MQEILKTINKFIDEMGYINNPHFLGVYFYGSSYSGFAENDSDIDLHVIFDDFDKTHIYRGVHFIENTKIEYFEKCISDLYLSVDNDIKERNIAWHSMLATSYIVYDKTGELAELQKYTLNAYKKGLPKLDEQDTYEYISIIDNRMQKLKKAYEQNSPHFYHLYHITIEKIRRFYHSINGLPRINTSKIYKIYQNDEYRKSYYPGKFVSQEFKDIYFDLINPNIQDKQKLYEKLLNFYNYVKAGKSLPNKNYRIKIKSRNISSNKKPC